MAMLLRLLAALIVLVAVPVHAAPAWVADELGETPDPAVRYGELANGFRYAIMRSGAPRGVAVVSYRIGVGLAQEGATETEFAHMVEHMAFGATAAFPGGDAIATLQAAGMQVGRDLGGFTTARGTLYTLSVATVTPERLDLAFRFLRGLSDAPAFDANELEHQKGVIAAEIAGGETQVDRVRRAQATLVYPELPFLRRLPADRLASVRAVDAARLRAFHSRWYRPDNGFLVIVGDVDPGATATAIEAAFASWVRPATPLPPAPPAAFTPRKPAAATVIESGLNETVAVSVARPRPEAVATPETRRRYLLAMLGLGLVRDRTDRRLIADPNDPVAAVNVSGNVWPGTLEAHTVEASARPGRWRDALALVENETRRPLEPGDGGFTLPEVDRAVTTALKAVRAASVRAASRTSPELAKGIVNAYADRTAFVLPERDFQRTSAILSAATPDEVLAAYRATWASGPPAVLVTGPAGLPATAPDAVAAYAVAHAAKLGAADLTLAAAKELPLPGPPGKVVHSGRVADLDVRLIEFANRARLTIKRTDFRTGEVVVRLRLGGGLLSFPADRRIVAPPVGTLMLGGAGGLDLQELLAGLRGRLASPAAALGEGVIAFTGRTSPGDLTTQLNLWAALIGAPRFDPRADGLLRAQFETMLAKVDATPQAAFARRWSKFIHGDDPRFAPPEAGDRDRITMASAKATWGPLLADAPIELVIVGDIDEAMAIDAAAKTIGALPPRRSDRVRSGHVWRLPPAAPTVVWRHGGDAARAIVASAWPALDGVDMANRAPLQALAAILQNRLFNELRQTAGATYSPSSLFEASEEVPGFGYVGAAVEVAVTDVPLAERSLRTIAASLAETGPTDEEFTRVVAPLLSSAALAERTNDFWMNGLDWAQTRADALDRLRIHLTALRALKVETVRTLAKTVFAAPPLTVRVVPGEVKAGG